MAPASRLMSKAGFRIKHLLRKAKTAATSSHGRGDPDYWSELLDYEWKPLKHIDDRRLVEIYPAENLEDPVIISLTQHSPDSVPKYTALSYRWGDPTLVYDICVLSEPDSAPAQDANSPQSSTTKTSSQSSLESYRVRVHHNLLLALRRLRSKTGCRIVWTDFLCINQSDNVEKSEQIQRMTHIYSEARQIAVYLGEDLIHRESEQIDMVFKALSAQFDLSMLSGYDPQLHFQQALDALVYLERKLKRRHIFKKAPGVLELLDLFFGRGWFYRVWMVQEVDQTHNKSEHVTVMLGGHQWSWDTVTDARYMWSAFAMAPGEISRGDKPADDLGYRFSVIDVLGLDDDKEHGLFWLLKECQILEASDPRDHCYAILGLTEHAQNPELKPDYTETVVETYKRYTRFLIRDGFGTRVLECCGHPARIKDLPSWVSDWSVATHRYCSVSHFGGYTAGGDRTESRFALLDHDLLSVSAVVVDKPEFSFATTLDELTEIVPQCNVNDDSAVAGMCDGMRHLHQCLLDLIQRAGRPAIGYETEHNFLCGDTDGAEERSRSVPPWFESFVQTVNGGSEAWLETLADISPADVFQQLRTLVLGSTGRRTCITSQGYLARVSIGTLPDDLMVIVPGCDFPLVLRQLQPDDAAPYGSEDQARPIHRIVGHAYVHEMMDGQVFNDPANELVEFTIA